jgi:hypothetical protein
MENLLLQEYVFDIKFSYNFTHVVPLHNAESGVSDMA